MSAEASGSSLGLGGILTIIFAVAKITGAVSWSWWWVFSPIWIPTLAIVGVLGVGAVVALLGAIIAGQIK